MSVLKELKIAVGKDVKARDIFEKLHPNFFEIKYNNPTEYVKMYWDLYVDFREKHKAEVEVEVDDEEEVAPKKKRKSANSTNGKIFEYILATLLIREDIMPLFLNAKVAFVPNVNYDAMLYTEEKGPVCISAKTSLRERYKQADLEAIALKYVHRKALAYLITLDEKESINVKAKIISGDVIGLDNVIVATNDEFNQLISSLKKFKFIASPTKIVVESNQIITKESVEKVK